MSYSVQPHTLNCGNSWDISLVQLSRHCPWLHLNPTLPTFRRSSPLFVPGAIHWLRGLPDTMEDHGSSIPSLLLSSGLPFVMSITCGGSTFESHLPRLLPYLESSLGVLAQNNFVEDYINSLFPGKYCRVIPNGVDPSLFHPPATPPGLTAGSAGMFNNGERYVSKGIPEFLSAISGMGSWEAKLTTTRVPHKEMPLFYQKCRAFVLPSLNEGCSNVLMEAMACGCVPIVLPGTGYHGETILHLVDGLFTTGTSKDISSWLSKLEDPEVYRALSKRAREYALMHTWHEIALQHKVFFKGLPRRA